MPEVEDKKVVNKCAACHKEIPDGMHFCNDQCRADYWHIPVEDLGINPLNHGPINFSARMLRWKKDHQVRIVEEERISDNQMMRLNEALKENYDEVPNPSV